MTRRWRCIKISKAQSTMVRDPRGNMIIETAPGIVIYQLVSPYRTREQLLIYPSVDGWTAYLTGTEGKEVTDRLPQERWAELFSQPHALLAILGDIGKLPDQEIF